MKERTQKSTFLALGLVLVALIALLVIPATTTMGAKPVSDADGDGYTAKKGDCNDNDPLINPGAEEICDNQDNNCDGQIDEGCTGPVDADGDGVTNDLDCNDDDPLIYPGAEEVCANNVDDDCDGITDEGCSGSIDSDGDGFLDTEEENGIDLTSTDVRLPGGGSFLPMCQDPADQESPCVHPDRPDLFVLINRDSPSNIPEDPLAILRGFVDTNGAPLAPHEVVQDGGSSSAITVGQNAVVINEYPDGDFGPLGFAPTNVTPYTATGPVDLYPMRVMNEVVKQCTGTKRFCEFVDGALSCTDEPVDHCQAENEIFMDDIAGLQEIYIRNVLAHETLHVCGLAEGPEVTLEHFNSNSGVVMEQSIGAKATKVLDANNNATVTVTLYISDEFHPDSVANIQYK